MLQFLLIFGFHIEPEYAMLIVLVGEWLVFMAAKFVRSKKCFAG